MAARRPAKVVFPADIHQIAADIRRQALQNPDKDPVVPATRRRSTKKRATAKRAKTTKAKTTKAKTTRRRRT